MVAKALATGRPYVKLTGTTNEQITVGQSVFLLGEPGAKLTSTNPGTLLRIDGTIQVAIYDLEISGASGATDGFGIASSLGNSASISLARVKLSNNQAGGLISIGASVTISQSTISSNAGGGFSITNGAFVLVGNVFYNNGSDTSIVGGLSISTGQAGASRLEFNSFNSNKAQDGIAAGIKCAAGTFTARNNIISENGTPTNSAQIGGSCMHAYSIVWPGAAPLGVGNSAVDPLFKDTTTGDLHLKPRSPAIRAADPGSILTGIAERDIDGDVRSAPAAIGADEAR